jgi:hypothetical protein
VKVACAEAFGDSPDVRLFPEEETLMAKAVDRRRRKFPVPGQDETAGGVPDMC